MSYSRPAAGDTGHDGVGRIDGASLARLVTAPDAHYLLCGPVGFLASLSADLERGGVPAERIHGESFGRGESA